MDAGADGRATCTYSTLWTRWMLQQMDLFLHVVNPV